MTLGQKLKQTRLARGMTQSQVVGDRITRNMLSQIENDLASPSVGTLEYLASVLNVRLSWLLADEQEEAEAGCTQRLRELLKSGEYAACLELAPEHAPDDEQALALAMAAATALLSAVYTFGGSRVITVPESMIVGRLRYSDGGTASGAPATEIPDRVTK